MFSECLQNSFYCMNLRRGLTEHGDQTLTGEQLLANSSRGQEPSASQESPGGACVPLVPKPLQKDRLLVFPPLYPASVQDPSTKSAIYHPVHKMLPPSNF